MMVTHSHAWLSQISLPSDLPICNLLTGEMELESEDACSHAAACRSEGLAAVAQLTVTEAQRRALETLVMSETRQTYDRLAK